MTKNYSKYILSIYGGGRDMEVATIQKWGNSQGIRIPKRLLDSLQWQQGERIILSAKNKKLLIEKAPKNQL